MSRIDALIAELCPEGVEHKALGDVGKFIRGNGLQKKDLVDMGVGAIHYGQVYTHYGIWAIETKSFVSSELAKRLRKASYGDLVIAPQAKTIRTFARQSHGWARKKSPSVAIHTFIAIHLSPNMLRTFFILNNFNLRRDVTSPARR